MLRVLLLLAALGATSLLSAAPASARPNVLFIVVDDLRTDLGCYGDPIAITPHIDALARRSTLFTRAYCQQAVCNPSRQSVLSGRRPDTLRVWDLKTHFRTTRPDVVSLPEYFKRHGYHAQSIGKIFHGEPPMADPSSWSVPETLEYVEKREDYRLPANRQPPGRSQKADATEFVEAPDEAYPDGKVAMHAVAALDRLAAVESPAPFFLAVGFMKPHLPFTAPRRYWDLHADTAFPPPVPASPPAGAPELALHPSVELRGYRDMPAHGDFSAEQITRLRRGYHAATSFTDAQIGKVLDALERSGLVKNTVVVLWSDHGFHLGEHGLWAKTTNYEADTRVPLLIAQPGQDSGRQTAALTELIDLFPTLVDLCGLPEAPGWEGRSLRPWLENPVTPSRSAVFSQFPRPWMYRGQPEFMGYAVRTSTHRYIEWRRFGTSDVVARELYAYDDGATFESENLASIPSEAGRMRELAALLHH